MFRVQLQWAPLYSKHTSKCAWMQRKKTIVLTWTSLDAFPLILLMTIPSFRLRSPKLNPWKNDLREATEVLCAEELKGVAEVGEVAWWTWAEDLERSKLMTVWYLGEMAEWAELVRLVKPISSGEAKLRGCWYETLEESWKSQNKKLFCDQDVQTQKIFNYTICLLFLSPKSKSSIKYFCCIHKCYKNCDC